MIGRAGRHGERAPRHFHSRRCPQVQSRAVAKLGYRAWFGTRRSAVRIRPARPTPLSRPISSLMRLGNRCGGEGGGARIPEEDPELGGLKSCLPGRRWAADGMVLPFLAWLDGQGVYPFEQLDGPRAAVPGTAGVHGRPARPAAAAEAAVGVAPGHWRVPALGRLRGIRRRRAHPRLGRTARPRQEADGVSHRPAAGGAGLLGHRLPTPSVAARSQCNRSSLKKPSQGRLPRMRVVDIKSRTGERNYG